MSFESNISESIYKLNNDLTIKKRHVKATYHHCDCDYCERDDELINGYTEADVLAQQKEIDEIDRTITRLKAHAALWHLDWKTGHQLQPTASGK